MVPSFEAAAATMDGPDPSPARDGMGTRVVSRLQGLSAAAARQVIATAQALEAGRPDVARAHLAPAMASHPSHPEVLRLHAGMLDLQGDHRGALADMQRALAQRPDDPLYYNTLGSILGAAGDFDSAIGALRRACELQPDLAIAWPPGRGPIIIACFTDGRVATPAVRNPVHAAVARKVAAAFA